MNIRVPGASWAHPPTWRPSKLGLRGNEKITDDLSGVFQLESQFNPTSGQMFDALKSLTQNNGVSTGPTRPPSSPASSRSFSRWRRPWRTRTPAG